MDEWLPNCYPSYYYYSTDVLHKSTLILNFIFDIIYNNASCYTHTLFTAFTKKCITAIALWLDRQKFVVQGHSSRLYHSCKKKW